MYYRDDAPPHFYAIYGDDEAIIDIASGAGLDGKLSRRALSLVLDWLAAHRQELLDNWQLARAGQPLNSIAPLD